MARAAVSFGVVLGLLLCPLRCFGVLVPPGGPTPGAEGCCCDGCAADSPEYPAPIDGDPANEDAGCEQCLCEGCIIATARSIPIEPNQLSFGDIPYRAALEGDSAALTRWAHGLADRSIETRPPGSGRALRIVLGSMQF